MSKKRNKKKNGILSKSTIKWYKETIKGIERDAIKMTIDSLRSQDIAKNIEGIKDKI